MTTPREQFLDEQKNIKEANVRARALEDGLDPDEVKAIEKEADELDKILEEEPDVVAIDKNMGERKIEVTQEQYLKEKERKTAQETLRSLAGLRDANKQHLSQVELETLNKILREASNTEELSPVLRYMLKTKIKIAEEMVKAQVQIKKLQMDLLNEMTKVTDAVVKCKGNVELVDKQILEFYAENKGLIEKEVDSK